MQGPQFVVGIDLGTTHCAIAAALLERPRLHLLKVPQLVAPGEVTESELLPSFLYLPAPGELTESERRLPWGAPENVVGVYARKRGAKSPNRLVASAKSWICHGGVNRRAEILPWSAPDTEPHVSPFEAQVAYLAHLESTWNAKHPDAPLAEQEVVVTVPASFDEAARQLTTDAAKEAGLGAVRLLEEPQAAFYDYLGANADEERSPSLKEALRQRLNDAKLILVVDIGGGTTDLTLLRVLPDGNAEDHEGSSSLPTIERIAVGGHLMLGGDNMDAALAVFALSKANLQRPEDPTIWSALVQSARDAKERLLSANAPAEAVISFQSRGSRLVGNTKSIPITREEAETVLLDGCFPRSGPSEMAERSARAGLTTLGLPYSSDTAIPRHICSFLRRHGAAALEAGAKVEEGLPRPDLLLLNGGVFEAPAVVERLLEVFAGWFEAGAPALLEHTSLSTSVAQGAVRSGLSRHGRGTVIGGGTARAYYIGVEHEGRTRALCVAPRNVHEGTRMTVPDRLFELRLNEPVAFPLFSYSGDRTDVAGTVIDVRAGNDGLEALAPLETLLRGKKNAKVRESKLAVSLESFVDEAGSLQLELVSAELPPRRWKLEFVVRRSAPGQAAATQSAESAPPEPKEETALPPHASAADAARLAREAFSSSNEERVTALRLRLEQELGPRGEWSGATCRVLVDALLSVSAGRAHSEAHELNWLRLLSWTMRPGFGIAGDSKRMDELWALREGGPAVPSKANWGEWWILWRRVAAGLDAARQEALFQQVRPWLWRSGKPPSGTPLQGPVEMMRMIAALERISPASKGKSGELFLERVKKLGSYWPLGRVGARVLFHGPGTSVVEKERAELWLARVLELDWSKAEGAAFAAAQMARMTGDVFVDANAELRQQVAQRLTEEGAPASWVDMVVRTTDLAQGDMKRVLGDSLPPGLTLS